jgi:hypothetical protein
VDPNRHPMSWYIDTTEQHGEAALSQYNDCERKGGFLGIFLKDIEAGCGVDGRGGPGSVVRGVDRLFRHRATTGRTEAFGLVTELLTVDVPLSFVQ